MIGDFQGLLFAEIVTTHHIKNTGAAGVLGRRRLVNDEVVVLLVLTGISPHAGNQRIDARKLAQSSQVSVVSIKIA